MTTPARVKAPETADERKALFQRAAAGDESCLPEVRAWLDARPGMVPLNGSPAGHLIDALLARHSDVLVREAVRRRLAEVQSELEGPAPTPIERLLAERIAICWYQVNRYEWIYVKSPRLSIREADHCQRRIDAAQRRFLSAVKTLAVVRRLATPALQVNIGARQVNVASDGASALPAANGSRRLPPASPAGG